MVSTIIMSLIYMVLISVIYFGKETISNSDNRIYKKIVYTNIIGLIIDILQYFSIKLGLSDYIVLFLAKAFLVYLNVWTYSIDMEAIDASYSLEIIEDDIFELNIINSEQKKSLQFRLVK